MDTDKVIIKTPEQIEGIRKSCHLAYKCLCMVEELVRPGIRTGELDEVIDGYIKFKGGTSACRGYKGFPAATCISVNEVICHGVPGDYILQQGDIVNIDVTTIVDGYYGDTSRMYAVGKIDEESDKLLRVAKECLEIGIQQVKPDNYTGNIGYWIHEHAKKNGCDTVKQLCGHGVGIFFHEPPDIPFFGKRYSGFKLKPGMVITIEPMVNLGTWEGVVDESDGWTIRTKDGKRSAQYEETVLVTDSGYEILTKGQS
jgi:methionyl aminopeptidase